MWYIHGIFIFDTDKIFTSLSSLWLKFRKLHDQTLWSEVYWNVFNNYCYHYSRECVHNVYEVIEKIKLMHICGWSTCTNVIQLAAL